MSPFTNHLPPEPWANSDIIITQVLMQLRDKHNSMHAIYLETTDLIKALDRLFDRKTFRHEPQMEKCITHNWESRLHSALKTKRVLQIYTPNIIEKGSGVQQDIYSDLLRWLDEYIECMAGFLFQKKINYQQMEQYIGTNDFEPFITQFITLKNLHELAPEHLRRLNNGLEQTITYADLLRKSVK